ncbi:MAG: hypothetical protein KatS3mg101_0554 [Patescibacteria group bacterium]|nr:MAG: hypothetical protein KatS3mg101_0554 [Patescibacteria group bacterium]
MAVEKFEQQLGAKGDLSKLNDNQLKEAEKSSKT